MSVITRIVHNQEEFDQAVADGHVGPIEAFSHAAARIVVRDYGGGWVTARGNVCIDAYRSQIRAREQSMVNAYDSSYVTADDDSTVDAYDESAVIAAYGRSSVRTYNGSEVGAFDSSTVEAHGRSTINAHDASQVTAHDGTLVNAYDDSRTTVLGHSSAIIHSPTATADGDGSILRADDADLPDTDPVPPSGEVYVPAGTTTTKDGQTVTRRAYVRRKK